ncbi:Ankyrin family protein [Chlamydiales bacterium STE3]|nr:Ankyrin family protein [Chlamydiales bacterium STE3]
MIDFLENLEDRLQRQEKILSEELIRNESLDVEIADYLTEYRVSEEQLTQFVSQKQHFSEENWQDLQKFKIEMENKLTQSLDNIANPLKLKKAYKDRVVPPQWLFVR